MFSDVLVEQLESRTHSEKIDVLATIVALCEAPGGKHPLYGALAGWNTVEVLGGHGRVVYKASAPTGVGLIEVLCLGPRSGSEVYDIARGLSASGVLDPEEVTQLWEALGLLDVVVEAVGLDGWDYRPAPAPPGLVQTVVASGLLTEAVALHLSQDEILTAMAQGWLGGSADPEAALIAALERARSAADFGDRDVISERATRRCGALMPRAGVRCARRAAHPGPHRAAPGK